MVLKSPMHKIVPSGNGSMEHGADGTFKIGIVYFASLLLGLVTGGKPLVSRWM